MNNLKWRIVPLVALGFGLVSTAAAGPAGSRTQPTNKGQTGKANATVVAALHQAHKLLAQADHDYQGHRAKAASDITHAIRELGGHHGAKGAGGAAAGNKAPGGVQAAGANKAAAGNGNGNAQRIPQAQSDAMLQQAIQTLTGIQGQLPGGHKAAAHVQDAIAELNTALKIK